MTKLIFYLLLLTLSKSAYCQETIFIDSIMEIQQVKSIAQRNISFKDERRDTTWIVYEYNRSGQLSSLFFSPELKSYQRFFYEEDQLISTLKVNLPAHTSPYNLTNVHDPNHPLNRRSQFTDTTLIIEHIYDSNDILQQVNVNHVNRTIYVKSYVYNEQGKKAYIQNGERDPNSDLIQRKYIEESFEYNELGELIIHNFYTEKNDFEYNRPNRTIKNYYENGKISKSIVRINNLSYHYFYNEIGQTIKRADYTDGQLRAETHYTYDKNGLIQKKKYKNYHALKETLTEYTYTYYE